jgi:glutamate synthase (NADPH) small chain
MGKERGFLEYQRNEAGYRPVVERVRDFRAVDLRLSEADLRDQAARCMDCGIPFCHGCGCPLENVIPEFNDHVYNGRWKDALDILLQTDPFPEFTGAICPAPCETACVLGINDDPVSIRAIELAIIEKGFAEGYMAPRPPSQRRTEQVAVVGSGPAGLAAAQILNGSGYNVTVYELAANPGGILRYGIPDFKLEKRILDRRIALMSDEGVVFETGVEIGVDISHRYLQDRFDAIMLTGGAREPRDLDVPGRRLDGIHFAMDFLVQQNMLLAGEHVEHDDRITANHKCVVILGGGDTGSDCLGTSLRQGAREVSQFEILPEPPACRAGSTPWPQWPLMRRDSSSHKEGGQRCWSVTTEAFGGKNGCVEYLDCAEVEWVAAQPGARPSPRKISGSEFRVEAELVLLAMGFVGPGPNRMVADLGLEVDQRGFIKHNDNHMTSRSGIFVAGDMSAGASLVVRAIRSGIEAGCGVMRYLGQ